MSKTTPKKLSRKLKRAALTLFADNITNVESTSSADKFLNSFFTPAEKEIILRRLITTMMLDKGYKYRKIQDTLGISRNTISKAKRILSGDGYGRNLGKRIYSNATPHKTKQRKLFRPYKGAESII